jgi:hypothetical protein
MVEFIQGILDMTQLELMLKVQYAHSLLNPQVQEANQSELKVANKPQLLISELHVPVCQLHMYL